MTTSTSPDFDRIPKSVAELKLCLYFPRRFFAGLFGVSQVMEWRKYKEAIAESREAAFFFRLRVNHKFNFPVLLRLEGCNIPQGGKDAL